MPSEKMRTEVGIALEDSALEQGVLSLGEASHFTCPECHGSMVRITDGPLERYRCHTGHAYSEKALAQEGVIEVEKTLWSALAQLEEHYLMLKRLAERHAAEPILARRYLDSAQEIQRMMQQTRRLALDPSLRPSQVTETE
jgi:two-component system chemotaxis response regulator CheB